MENMNDTNEVKKEKKKSPGFFKGVAVGMMSAVLMIAVLAGCSGISSLIGSSMVARLSLPRLSINSEIFLLSISLIL